MGQDYTWIVFIAVMAVMLWWMSRSSKKVRSKMEAERESAIQVGTTVVTGSGFFGTIVDIDGDAVTLQSPSGDETVWLKSAIRSEAEIPLAITPEDDDVEDELPPEALPDSPDSPDTEAPRA